MKPIKLITENEIKSFIKSGTDKDVETYFNSLILIRKHIDRDNKTPKKYGVKLIKIKPKTGTYYKVGSNAIGQEAIRVLCKNHNIENGGSETNDSLYIAFYSEKA